MHYDKLVRDLIPVIISNSGRSCTTEVLDEAAYRQALLAKLVEEAHEVQAASPAELATELADVLEVLDALMEAHGISPDAVRNLQQQRRQERGGFSLRLRLTSID